MNTKYIINKSAQWTVVGSLCAVMGAGVGVVHAPSAFADPGAESFGPISGVSVALDKGSNELRMQVRCSGSADPKIANKVETPLSLRGVEDIKFEANGNTYTISGMVNSKEAVASTDVDICTGGSGTSKTLLDAVSVSFSTNKDTPTTVSGFCRTGFELKNEDSVSVPNAVGKNLLNGDRDRFAIDVSGTSVELSNFDFCKPYEQRTSTSDSYSSSSASPSSTASSKTSPEPEKDGWIPLPVKPSS